MRKFEIGLVQASLLAGSLLMGCGDKAGTADVGDTGAGDDASADVDDAGTVDVDGGPDADGSGDADADGGTDTGDDTGNSDSDADGGTDTGDTGDTDTDADADADADGTGPTGPTIKEVQDGVFAPGSIVTLANVVVSSPPTSRGTGFYVADAAGGEKSGLWVYSDWLDDFEEITFSVGQVVTVTGTVSEYPAAGADGEPLPDTESLTQIRVSTSTDVEITGSTDAPIPAAATTAILSVPETAEPWESVLVSLDDVSVGLDGEGDLTIGGGIRISDAFIDADTLRSGDTLSQLIGMVEFSEGTFKLAPRGSDDLVGLLSIGSAGSCAPEAAKCAGDLVAGDIAITEIMNNPGAGCGGGHAGEYIEVFNSSGSIIDLAGVDLSDAARNTYVASPLVIGPSEYAILEYADDAPCLTAGATSFPSATYGVVELNDGGDSVVLGYGGTELDRVDFMVSWPSSDGVSMQLNSGAVGTDWHVDNDEMSNWCPGVTSTDDYVVSASDDWGTPGAGTVCAL